MNIILPEGYECSGTILDIGEMSFDEVDETLLNFNYSVVEIPFYPHESFEEQIREDLGKFVLDSLDRFVRQQKIIEAL